MQKWYQCVHWSNRKSLLSSALVVLQLAPQNKKFILSFMQCLLSAPCMLDTIDNSKQGWPSQVSSYSEARGKQ